MTSAAAIVVPAAARQTATFIFCHGLGDTGAGWSAISENFRLRRKFDEMAFIFPHAPTIPITCNMGMRMPGWYDIKVFSDIDQHEDEAGMLRSVSLINRIISEQIDKGISSERIIIGGFSQGSVVSLLAGLTSERKLGGVVMLSGYLPLRNKIFSMRTDVAKNIPIFMGHGTRDNVIRYEYGTRSKDILESKGQKITWKSYEGLDHSADPRELLDLERWLEEQLKASPVPPPARV